MRELENLVEQAKSVPDRFKLSGKVALVVGGNKGLGQGMSLALAAAGSDVWVVGRGPEGLQETASAITGLGTKGRCIAADVTSEEEVKRVVGAVLEGSGRIDILVNS
jgi:2-deoxy-D-gluconate 3-dehydrogenase